MRAICRITTRRDSSSWPVAIIYAYIGEPMETDDTADFDTADNGELNVEGTDDVVSFE